jgi:diguanylate cyclase (GGDEF)-like protein
MTAQRLAARILPAYYITALTVIGGLTVISHLCVANVLQANHGAAAVMNMSGRQRMLSQRIALLAAEYELGDRSARRPLLASLDEFTDNETLLCAGALEPQHGGPSALELRQIYSPAFQAQSAAFAVNGRLVASLPQGDPKARAPLEMLFAQSRAPLLDQLNEVVTIHQQQTEQVLANLGQMQRAILLAVLLTLAAEAMVIFRPMIRRIMIYTYEIERLTVIDPLTGIFNRRGFMEACEVELARARRHDRPLSLLMLDVDHFKRINDTHGHAGGDMALRHLADTLRAALRVTDIAGRIGGEEFAVLLTETDLAGARQLAQRLRDGIAGAVLEVGAHQIRMTVSIGVAPVRPEGGRADGPIARAMSDADAAMYRAKTAGRNRVMLAA